MREVMSKSGITTVSNILQYQHFQWVSELQNPMPFGQCNLEKTLNTLRSLLGEFKARLRCLYCTIGSIGFGFYASTSTIYPPSCQQIDANSVVPPLQHWSSLIRMPCDPCAIGRKPLPQVKMHELVPSCGLRGSHVSHVSHALRDSLTSRTSPNIAEHSRTGFAECALMHVDARWCTLQYVVRHAAAFGNSQHGATLCVGRGGGNPVPLCNMQQGC